MCASVARPSSLPLAKEELLARLMALAAKEGLNGEIKDGVMQGRKEAIKARWFLGGIRSTYNFSCALDGDTCTATFRESIVDKSWGLAPPTVTVETSSQSGTTVDSTRRDRSVGGGGTLSFGAWRSRCQELVAQAGWRFIHQALRLP